MSREERLAELVGEGTLRYIAPLRGYSAARYVYLIDGLHRRVEREVENDGAEAERLAEVMAVLYAFIHGNKVTFGMDPITKGRSALLARTHPTKHGIVDFRVVDPSPGMRLLGGFAAADHFVGLRCIGRGEMKRHGGFSGCVRETRGVWVSIFGAGFEPVVSANMKEYVTKNVLEV